MKNLWPLKCATVNTNIYLDMFENFVCPQVKETGTCSLSFRKMVVCHTEHWLFLSVWQDIPKLDCDGDHWSSWFFWMRYSKIGELILVLSINWPSRSAKITLYDFSYGLLCNTYKWTIKLRNLVTDGKFKEKDFSSY